MMDESTLQKFYGDVAPSIRERFVRFLRTHTLESANLDGTWVDYYACGRGERTLLTFCGAHSTPYTVWETVAAHERDHRVLVLDVSGFGTVADLCAGVDRILEREGVGRVVLLGASLAGLIGQIYLKRHPDRVDGVVLMNTVAFKRSDQKPYNLLLARLLPEPLVRSLFRKKLRAYFRQALADPRTAERARFGLAHLEEVMARHFSKRKLINLLSVLLEFAAEGYTRADLEGWEGRSLVVTSEDDEGFKDLEWLLDNLPGAESHVFPAGLGHLPQLAHREELEALVRGFLARLG